MNKEMSADQIPNPIDCFNMLTHLIGDEPQTWYLTDNPILDADTSRPKYISQYEIGVVPKILTNETFQILNWGKQETQRGFLRKKVLSNLVVMMTPHDSNQKPFLLKLTNKQKNKIEDLIVRWRDYSAHWFEHAISNHLTKTSMSSFIHPKMFRYFESQLATYDCVKNGRVFRDFKSQNPVIVLDEKRSNSFTAQCYDLYNGALVTLNKSLLMQIKPEEEQKLIQKFYQNIPKH